MAAPDILVPPKELVRAHEEMTGDELRIWRAQRPGTFTYKRNQTRPGWSQDQAAEWAGISTRTWRRYENGETWPIPVRLIKRLQDYPLSIGAEIDRLFDTDATKVEKYGGVHEALKDEPKPDFDSVSQKPSSPRTKRHVPREG